MIEVDTRQYLPLHIAEIDEFKKIAKTYDEFLKLAWASLQKEELNRVLATMDESECAQWEQLLGIVINPADSLEDRVNRIRGYHVSDLPYTYNKLDEVLKLVCGGDNYKLKVDNSRQIVDCGVKIVSIQMIDVIFDLIRKRVPANMLVNVYALFNRWERFKQLRWSELITDTWKKIHDDKKWQEV